MVWLYDRLNLYIRSITGCIKDFKLMKKLIAISIVWFCLYFIWVDICFQSIQISVNLTFLSVFTAALLLSGTFNIVPGNLGLREIICGYLSQSMGLSLSDGIIASSIMRAAEYLTVTVLGVIFAKTFFIKKRIKELQNSSH